MKDAHESVLEMWRLYLNSIGETMKSTEKRFSSWHFEITKEGADNLANLVLTGRKKATAASLWVETHDQGVIPKIGIIVSSLIGKVEQSVLFKPLILI